jgi:nucleoside-diphosphate-sugar epimerase
VPAELTLRAGFDIHAKDVGRAVDLAATRPMPAQTVFNIGNGYLTTMVKADAVKWERIVRESGIKLE